MVHLVIFSWWSLLLGSCNITWLKQPTQTTLPCDPLGVDISLQCTSSPHDLTVTWFWTRNVNQAGINGTQIFVGMGPYHVTEILSGHTTLLFQVNESTVGYYWCEITDAGVDVRPSGIVPVCSNGSEPHCSDPYETYPHNPHLECAIQDSNFTVSHSGLPMDCALPSSSSISDTSLPVSPTSTTVLVTSMSVNTSTVFLKVSSRYESSNVHCPPSQLATESLIPAKAMASTDTHFATSFTCPSATQTAAMQTMVVMSGSSTSDSKDAGEDVILYALIAVCAVLAMIALLITIAIIVLCCLTRRRNIHQVASPSGMHMLVYTGVFVFVHVCECGGRCGVRFSFKIGKIQDWALVLSILGIDVILWHVFMGNISGVGS